MVTLDRVAALAAELPAVEETETRGWRAWAVGGKTFAWERPFSKADVRRFGDEPVPEGPILAVRTADLGEKDAALQEYAPACFTIPHFDGYAAVLLTLRTTRVGPLRELLADGWIACAPPGLAAEHLEHLERLRRRRRRGSRG